MTRSIRGWWVPGAFTPSLTELRWVRRKLLAVEREWMAAR